MLKIGIVEDNKNLGLELKNKIELHPDYKVGFIKPNGQEALQLLETNHQWDLIFMDIEMDVMNGIETTRHLQDKYPDIKVIMCSIYDDDQSIIDSILAGATGYMLKDEAPKSVHLAIEQAMEGGSPLNPLIAKKTLRLLKGNQNPKSVQENYGLTAREMEVLALANGKSYSEIAAQLFISTGTIRKHIENIYRKLNVNNKVDAVRKWSIH